MLLRRLSAELVDLVLATALGIVVSEPVAQREDGRVSLSG